MIGKFLVVALVLAGIAGCASVRMADSVADTALKQFSAEADAAGVYIYCNEWMGVINRTNVDLDGKPLGQNRSFTYLHARVAPGRHAVTITAENVDTLEFDAEAGRNYYVWQEVKLGWLTPRTQLHLMPESEGQKGVNAARLATPTYRTEDQSGAKAAAVAMPILGIILMIITAGHIPPPMP
jgi:hypothetical protein